MVFSTEDSNHRLLGGSRNRHSCLFCSHRNILAVHSLTTLDGFSILRVYHVASLTAVVPRIKTQRIGNGSGFIELIMKIN